MTVGEIEPRGETVRVRAVDGADGTAGLVAELTADAAADLELVPGREVWFAVKATEVALYAVGRTRELTRTDAARYWTGRWRSGRRDEGRRR